MKPQLFYNPFFMNPNSKTKLSNLVSHQKKNCANCVINFRNLLLFFRASVATSNMKRTCDTE